jgi:GNAT superfamily N-acetyltransferase
MTEQIPTVQPRLTRVEYGDPEAVALIEEVQAEYVVRYGGRDETPLDPLMFEPPAGSFFVAHLDGVLGGRAVATGAWRRHPVEVFGTTRTAEVKRMYVVPAARGRGVARAVLAHLEATAVEAGYEAMVLETGTRQPEAIALYESCGYVPVPKFGYYRDSPTSRCFGRRLVP